MCTTVTVCMSCIVLYSAHSGQLDVPECGELLEGVAGELGLELWQTEEVEPLRHRGGVPHGGRGFQEAHHRHYVTALRHYYVIKTSQ